MSKQLYRERGVAGIVNFIVRLSGKVARTVIFRLDFSWSAGVHLRSEGLSAAGTKGWRRIPQNEGSFPASAEVRGFPAVRGSRAARRPAVSFPGTWAQRRHRGRARPRRAPRIACAAPVTEATAAPTARRLGSALRATFKLF